MKRTLYFVMVAAMLLTITSCRTRHQMIYLEDLKPGELYQTSEPKDLVIQPDDKLSIKVTCKNPELAFAFNMPGSGGYSVSPDGTISSTSTPNMDVGYRVATDGSIDFPIIGKIQAVGLTSRQLTESIKNELKTRNLISDPYVTVDIINFTYSILGESKKVGTIEVKGKDRVTLLDAIAQAGDLSQDAKLDRIAVIREVDGKRQVFYNDIRSKEIFNSPVFYLKQNDIIYIEPNDNKVREESRRNLQWIFTGTSLLTTVISLITLITK